MNFAHPENSKDKSSTSMATRQQLDNAKVSKPATKMGPLSSPPLPPRLCNGSVATENGIDVRSVVATEKGLESVGKGIKGDTEGIAKFGYDASVGTAVVDDAESESLVSVTKSDKTQLNRSQPPKRKNKAVKNDNSELENLNFSDPKAKDQIRGGTSRKRGSKDKEGFPKQSSKRKDSDDTSLELISVDDKERNGLGKRLTPSISNSPILHDLKNAEPQANSLSDTHTCSGIVNVEEKQIIAEQAVEDEDSGVENADKNDGVSKIGRLGHRNFSPEDRKLLFMILESMININKIAPKEGINWNEVANEFNWRKVEMKNSNAHNQGTTAFNLEEPSVTRTAKSLKRYLDRLAKKYKHNKEDSSDDVWLRAAKILEWEDRNKRFGHNIGPQNSIGSVLSMNGTYFPEPGASNTNTQLHRLDHQLPYQSPQFMYLGHTPGVLTGSNTPSHGYSHPIQRKPTVEQVASENEADIEDDDDDDVQSKHSHTTSRSQGGVGDMQISQLLNYDGNIDSLPFPQSYNNNDQMLDGIFTPHSNYTKDAVHSSHPSSARKRRPTSSSTGYESGSRRRIKQKTTRGMSQDGTEFINFGGGFPSTPGQTFLPSAGSLHGTNVTVPNAGTLHTGINNLIEGNEAPLNMFLNSNASGAAPSFGGRSEELIVMKDKMIVQLQSTIYTIFQDLKQANERIKHLMDSEAANIHNYNKQEQRHMNEVRTMEVVHRERIQDYEAKLGSLEMQIRKMKKRHQQDINRVIKFVPLDQQKQALRRVKSGDRVYPYFNASSNERNQSISETNELPSKLTSPPPFTMLSPVIAGHHNNNGNSRRPSSSSSGISVNAGNGGQQTGGTGNLIKFRSRSRSLSPQSITYSNGYTGAGSLKKSSTNQQTKSVKLLSRDTIIKDSFSREEGTSSSDLSSFSD